MNTGEACPVCGDELWLMSTNNQWNHYCKRCDKRYNAKRKPMPPPHSPEWKP